MMHMVKVGCGGFGVRSMGFTLDVDTIGFLIHVYLLSYFSKKLY